MHRLCLETYNVLHNVMLRIVWRGRRWWWSITHVMSSQEPHSDITRMMMMRRRSVFFSLHFRSSPLYLFQHEKKLPSLELTTLYWFCSISAQILKTRAIYVCPNYDNQKSAWEAVLIAVCCIGFQLHWITFIILQLPLCIRLPLLLSHWISLHLPNVTPLHIIALYCSELH